MAISSTVRRIGLVIVFGTLCYVSFRHHYQIQTRLLQRIAAVAKEPSLPVSSPSSSMAETKGGNDDEESPTFPALAGLASPVFSMQPPSLIPTWPMDKSVHNNVLLRAVSSLATVFTSPSSGMTKSSWESSWGTWGGFLATLLLGFILGILFSETPFVDPILRLFGLADSRRFGVDILEGTAWTCTGSQGREEGSKVGRGGSSSSSTLNVRDIGTDRTVGVDGTAGMTASEVIPPSSTDDEETNILPVRQTSGGKRVNYGLRYTFLNVEVTGGWLGMGLWPIDGTKIPYREACQAMVRKVTAGLNIDEKSHLLDVGFGCGDQTVYMAELYRPKRITGITIEPLQHYAAEQLVLNSRNRIPATSIDLYVADASRLLDFVQEHQQKPGTQREPSTRDQYFTHIISIDSAYHFNTRRQFFEQAYAVLAPGKGRLAMADVIPTRDPPVTGLKGWLFRQFSRLYLKVPLENMQTLEAYRQTLVEVGFEDIEIEAVEDQVFLGWADFIATQLKVLKSVGLVRPRVGWSFWAIQKVLRYVDRKKTMQFIVVKAKRGT